MTGAIITHAVGRLNQLLALAAGSALFLLMTLTFIDVLGRKFWHAVPGALEVSEMLMVIVLFCALPIVSWRAEHVSFELVDNWYRGRLARWSLIARDLICAAMLGLLGSACFKYAGRTLVDGGVSVYLRIPTGWFVYLISIMLMLAALLHLLRCVSHDQRT